MRKTAVRCPGPAQAYEPRWSAPPLRMWPGVRRAGLRQSPALTPGQRRRRRRLDLQIGEIRQVGIYLRLRRACLRMASTFAANAVGSMIGVPRHGDIDSRSVPLETMSSAPTSAARSRIDRGLRVYAGQGPFRLIGMGAQSRKRTCAQGYG